MSRTGALFRTLSSYLPSRSGRERLRDDQRRERQHVAKEPPPDPSQMELFALELYLLLTKDRVPAVSNPDKFAAEVWSGFLNDADCRKDVIISAKYHARPSNPYGPPPDMKEMVKAWLENDPKAFSEAKVAKIEADKMKEAHQRSQQLTPMTAPIPRVNIEAQKKALESRPLHSSQQLTPMTAPIPRVNIEAQKKALEIPPPTEWEQFALDVNQLWEARIHRCANCQLDIEKYKREYTVSLEKRKKHVQHVKDFHRLIDSGEYWPFMVVPLKAWIAGDGPAFWSAKPAWDKEFAEYRVDEAEFEAELERDREEIRAREEEIRKTDAEIKRLEREIEKEKKERAELRAELAADKARLAQLELEAAQRMWRQKFGEKVLWSVVRHAFMATFTAGVGNVLLGTWDAMDAAELASTIQDLSDANDQWQQQLGSGSDGPHFGASQDVPLAGGGMGNYDDHGNLTSYADGKLLSKWDRANY